MHPFGCFVRIKPGNPAPALSAMQKAWKASLLSLPFKYGFMMRALTIFIKRKEDGAALLVGPVEFPFS